MPHNIQTIAFHGEAPWHHLGVALDNTQDLDLWRRSAGMDWHVDMTPVRYRMHDADELYEMDDRYVLARSDSKRALSVVSSRYRLVQPQEVLEFYRDLVNNNGYEMETAGVLGDGQRVWALARTGLDGRVRGNDVVNCYLLLATSYDGSMATTARFTSVRVVCQNTLSLALAGKRAEVSIPHNKVFDADKVKFDLKVGDTWRAFTDVLGKLAETPVTLDQRKELYKAVYLDPSDREALREDSDVGRMMAAKFDRLCKRVENVLANGPGANMRSAAGTAWGALNAVTFDIDHSPRTRSPDTRLNSAWFGDGEQTKLAALAFLTEVANEA